MRALAFPSSLGVPARREFVGGVAFATVFALLFWPTFRWMAERFDAHDSFYSHGWLVPLASAWLIWHRRATLTHLPRSSSYAGLWLLVPSVLAHLFTTWWHIGFLSGFAMLGTIWGLVWTVWGWPVLWSLRVPMLFLLFMVPLPGVLLISTSFRMKLVAASLATHVLTLTGIPAEQAGSTIHVPGMSVIVDDTCSGLRSLISLIALAALWTALMPSGTKRWQKLTVIAASVPIALVANMVRILVLVLLSAIYGPGIAEGFIHYGSGVVVFGIALLALSSFSRVVLRCSPPSLVHPRLPSAC
ncbi:MAG: exosortase/archaeosortase family protein [Candidatus Omnitrophica bacterium]|nr:exosortase/archaeosortase family protein [Candidatus Omnitrophota bacterium]